ncbi:thioesterase-like superfamily-domain-containing protein [Aspergillus pseudoustus]|uniref:Thioesterase-like superfamily-domain-containing protein n=1 Tax=Aspergillus pseudoustus TaxID=1810923 RepID=A0ABR4JPT4_9EURO
MEPPIRGGTGTSPIEKCCAIRSAPEIGPDTFTNVNPIWHPPGARGIYGGAAIAQCLNAAYETVSPDFAVHSMHCHFLVAANSNLPVCYSVERIRDGRSFSTRCVRAVQGDSCFFLTTISFQNVTVRSSLVLADAVQPPEGARPPEDTKAASDRQVDTEEPFEKFISGYVPGPSPATRKPQQWIRAYGPISGRAQIVALAYMSDSDFVNAVSRVHRLVQFSTDEYMQHTRGGFQGSELERLRMEEWLQGRARAEISANEEAARVEGSNTLNHRVGMLVSLDHTIFFHNHPRIRADQWLLSEMGCPWTGDERAVVTQHIWTTDGVLVATCIQEGVVRVAEEDKARL